MGWTLDTYHMAPAVGDPSNLAQCMFELVRGVNERRELVGLTPALQLYTANGTVGAINSAADLLWLPIENWNITLGGSTNPSPLYSNMYERIQAQILALIDSGLFMQASGASSALDRAWVSAQIGTDIETPPAQPLESRWWQAMQDALDLLLYLRKVVDLDDWVTEADNPDIEVVQQTSDGDVDLDTAWAEMTGDTPTAYDYWPIFNFSGLPFRTNWKVSRITTTYYPTSNRFQGIVVELPTLAGTLSHARFRGKVYAQNHDLAAVDVRIGDAVATLDLTGFTTVGGVAANFESGGFTPPALSTTLVTSYEFDTEIATAFPGTSPLEPSASVGPGGTTYIDAEVMFFPTHIDLFFDLSPALSDQV